MPALVRTGSLRTCQRLRDGRAPAEGLALSAVRRGLLVGTVRLWHVSAGGRPALVLGPLAVDRACRKLGVGAALMQAALAAARDAGHPAVILLGDAPYYARFGFSADKTGDLSLPGPFERDRLLGLELRQGGLDSARGLIAPSGALLPRPKAARTSGTRNSCRRRPEGLMSKPPVPPRDAARPRLRNVISTVLLIMLSILIIRDVLVRRWDSATPERTDVTQRSR